MHQVLPLRLFSFLRIGEPGYDGESFGRVGRLGRQRGSIGIVAWLFRHTVGLVGQLALSTQHLSPRGSRRVQHDDHNTGIVRSQLVSIPLFYGHVYQAFAGVLPGMTSLGVQHVLLVVLLRYLDCINSMFRGENIPGSVGPENEAPVLADIDRVDVKIWLRGDDKVVRFAVV
jgi:hypothetical protein